jgi:ketosteroid isomerase-like protein
MKFLLLCLLALSASAARAATGDAQDEIDAQVWRPFIQAQLSLDHAAYFGLHSRDVVRVERNTGRVQGYAAYAEQVVQGFRQAAEAIKSGAKAEIDMRFTERAASGDLAYEVGYYKTRLTLPTNKQTLYYSQFHVALRKENGRWKILTDSSLPMPGMEEAEFQTGRVIGS